jgi:hypothetical protein
MVKVVIYGTSTGVDPINRKLFSMSQKGLLHGIHTMATTTDLLAAGSCEAEQAINKPAKEKKHHLQGGYECIFIKDPPEILQTECPICLCVLKEPYLIDCCGTEQLL